MAAAVGLRTVLMLSLIGTVCITAQKMENCDRRLDLAFIVDSSGSICEKDPSVEVLPNGRKTCDNWKLVLSFMEKAVDKMEIGANKVRTAMVDFSNSATLVWDFKRYTNDKDVLEGIAGLQYKSHNTNTSGGFRVAYQEVFNREAGDRAGVPNVAILISDGVSTYDKNLTIPTANALKKDKQVVIFGVGVTKAIDEAELKAISSDPQILGENYFLSADFDELESILNALVQQTCEVVEPKQEGNEECNRMDLAFLIDRSGSICEKDPSRNDRPNGCDNWDLVRDFTTSVVDAFSIGPDFVRVALAVFGNTGELQWDLLGYSDKQSLTDAVKQIPHKYHNTNTSGGLNVLYDEVFTKEGGDRDNVVNVVIVITDGKSTFDNEKTVPTAKKLREDKNAIMFSIGITDQINEQELKEISSLPQVLNSNYFMTASFANLSNILGSIVNRTCEDVQKAESNCPKDLIFVLDYSGSIGPNKYNYVRDFVVTFIESLDNDTKVGVVLFNDNHKLGFHLNKYSDPKGAAAAVNAIKFQGGRTNTGAAIGYMHKDMFTTANGDREDMDNVVIVITDGKSNTPDKETVIRESRQAKSKGIHMLVLGITKWADDDELIAIASYPASVNVIMVPKVDFLSDYQREVKDLVCNKVNECGAVSCKNGGKCEDGIGIAWCICPPGFAGENCGRVCREPADIALALDSSGSIKRLDFRKEVNFAANLILKGVNVDGYSRLGLLEFADSSKMHWALDSFTSGKAMLDAFDFYTTRGKTDTAGALKQMQDEVFVMGDTNGRNKIGVVVSDGRSDSPKDTWQNAMTLRSSGKDMIAVGVGRNARPKELESIASNGNVMNLESFDDLDSLLNTLSDLLCNNVNDCDPNPCQNGGVCTDKIGGYKCTCPADFTGSNCERACSGKMDLVFVFDASGSMRRQRFYTAVEMAVNITKQLEVAPDKTRVAAIYFADNPELAFTLDQYSVKQDIIQHMKTQILYKRGRTDMASALDMMMESIFDTPGDRSEVPNICITITCGRSNIRQQDTIPKALEAKGKCHMISVGVGSQPAMDELEAMATDPSADMFLTPSWRDMAGKVQGILDATCTKE